MQRHNGFKQNKVSFNFLKSLEIAHINNETMLLHPSAHEFWEEESPTESRNIHFCIIVGFNLFIKMSESIHHRPKSFVHYRIHREQAQATINQLLAVSKKVTNIKAQINFLMRCKKLNLIPNGLNRRFFLSISNFSQSGKRLCQRFQRKLLLRILSDKH